LFIPKTPNYSKELEFLSFSTFTLVLENEGSPNSILALFENQSVQLGSLPDRF